MNNAAFVAVWVVLVTSMMTMVSMTLLIAMFDGAVDVRRSAFVFCDQQQQQDDDDDDGSVSYHPSQNTPFVVFLP
jgi:hypothetical protein